MMQELIAIGKIVNTHGIKGEVKVIPLTDFTERFNDLQGAHIVSGADKRLATVDVEHARSHKNLVILKFKGYDSINVVEQFKGAKLMVEKDNLVKLPPEHYYIFEIIGLAVYTDEGEYLGKITEVLSTSNDIYVVEKPEPGKTKTAQLLIPAIKDVVQEINLAEGKVVVKLLEGLR